MSQSGRIGVAAVLVIGMAISGCGGSGGGPIPKPPISVGMTPAASQAIDQGQTVSFTATVTNDSANAGVSWSVTGQGALSGQTTTAATYTAPTSGAPGTASVTATSVTDSTKNFSVNITVSAAPAFSTTSLPAAVIGTAYNQPVAVTGGAGALTFSIVSGSLPTGLSLNTSTGAITGTPTGATGTTSFTVKVTDSSTAGPVSATQAVSIAVNPPGALTISTTSLLNPLVSENYDQTLQFIQSSAVLPVTWGFAPGSGPLPAGLSLNPNTGEITGIPTTAGTNTFTVELTDSTSPTPITATQILSLTVTSATSCESGSEALLNGQYALSMTGFDGSGPAGILASFTADGTGKITAGVEDINSTSPSGVQANLPVTTAGSSYSVGSDNRGCLTLAVTGGATRIFRFTLGNISAGVAQNGRILEFDSTGSNTVGTISIQDPLTFSNAVVTGSYNFGLNSPLAAPAGGYFAAVGLLNLSGASGIVTGMGDINFNGLVDSGNAQYPASPITFLPGTYSVSSNGRGSLSFTPTGSPTINLVMYVLNASQVLFMSSDAQSATNALSSGFAGREAGNSFGNSSLNATSVLFLNGQTGTGASSAGRVEAGIFTPDSAGNFTFSGDQNSGGTVGTQNTSGTYGVATDGRVLVTATGSTAPTLIIYLVGPNQGLAMSTDPYVMVGDLEPQTGGPFSNSTLSGIFAIATVNPTSSTSSLIEGAETYDAGNVTATFEFNTSGSLSLGNAFAGTYTVSSSGRMLRTWNGSTQNLSYIISPTRVVTFGISPSNTNPTLVVSQQ